MNEDVMLRADEKKINWYPGHMARAKRALADQLSRVDVVVELCDARIPRASRNPDLADMIKNKRHLLVLGKADLADERETRAWLGYFRAQGIDCMSFDSIRGKAKDIIARIEKASADAVAKMAAKGVKKTVRVMIVGVPNVGKSTFTNRINGASIARTGDRPGVTRSNQWVRITPYLELLDTPGLLWPNLSDQQDARALAFVGTINDNIMDQQMLAIRLMERLMEDHADALCARFRAETAAHLLDHGLVPAVCRRGRGREACRRVRRVQAEVIVLADLLAQTVRPVGQHHLRNAEARNALRVPEVRARAQRGLLLVRHFRYQFCMIHRSSPSLMAN